MNSPAPEDNGWATLVNSALNGFLELECNDQVADWLRATLAAGGEVPGGHIHIEFNVFDIEVSYAEDRVTIAETAPFGYDPVQLTLGEFLAALPEIQPGQQMPS